MVFVVKSDICVYFFFFSSRRRHTRLQGDWSSDVCSSDLNGNSPAGRKLATTSTTTGAATRPRTMSVRSRGKIVPRTCAGQTDSPLYRRARSEERRVGEEGRSRWSPYH